MTDGERSAVGLSVGATNLAGVTADRAVTRKPVLTLYRQRPPEVGVPSENPKLDEPGLVIADFVNRVGNPVGIVAADGSTHRSEALLADGLRALAYTATGGRALPNAVAVTYPAHWRSAAVDALDAALSRVSEWSSGRLSLLPDAAAALVALQANPGVPPCGIIAMCDFGGTGTSITFMNAEEDYLPVGPTVRHADFSGELIDQALLNHVVAELSTAGSFDTSGTSAIGSLTRLRAECRTAKEQLSSSTVTTLTAELPGFRGDVRLNRTELDDAIRQPLGAFLAVLQEALERTGHRVTDLSAIGAVGGGASVPAVTTRLSEYFQVPVITAPRPHLTPAVGAALRASRGPAGNSETALAPTAAAFMPPTEALTTSAADLESSGQPALAWSEVDDSGIMPIDTDEYLGSAGDAGVPPIQPAQQVDYEARRSETHPAAPPASAAWYRRPVVVILGTALVVLAVGAAIIIDLTSGGGPSTPAPSVSTTPASGSSAPATSQPSQSSGSAESASTSAPSSTEPTTAPPSSSTEPTTTTQPSSSTPTTTTQTTQSSSATGQPLVPLIPRIPDIPRGRPQP